MKKICFVILFLLLFGLTSCNQDMKSSKDAAYQTTKESYVDKNIKISYPQITNLGDANKQKAINELIRSEALKGLNFYKGSDLSALDLDVNYEVKLMKENLISIVYSGVGYVKGAAYPNNLFYTTNIDIKNGVKLQLKDLIKIDDSLADKYLTGKFAPVDPKFNSYQKNVSKPDLLQALKSADSIDNAGTAEQTDAYSYLTNNSLGISLGVIHAAGDHEEYEIKYKDLKGSMLPALADSIS